MKTCGKCQLSKRLDEFGINRSKPGGLQNYCRVCKAKYFQDNRARLIPKIRAANKATRGEVTAYVDQYRREHPCEKCGEADPCVLDFHHPSGTKEFAVGQANQKGMSLNRVKKEISKCRVLCSNCHRKVHAGRFSL